MPQVNLGVAKDVSRHSTLKNPIKVNSAPYNPHEHYLVALQDKGSRDQGGKYMRDDRLLYPSGFTTVGLKSGPNLPGKDGTLGAIPLGIGSEKYLKVEYKGIISDPSSANKRIFAYNVQEIAAKDIPKELVGPKPTPPQAAPAAPATAQGSGSGQGAASPAASAPATPGAGGTPAASGGATASSDDIVIQEPDGAIIRIPRSRRGGPRVDNEGLQLSDAEYDELLKSKPADKDEWVYNVDHHLGVAKGNDGKPIFGPNGKVKIGETQDHAKHHDPAKCVICRAEERQGIHAAQIAAQKP